MTLEHTQARLLSAQGQQHVNVVLYNTGETKATKIDMWTLGQVAMTSS